MKIIRKKYTNPVFGSLQVKGKLTKLSIQGKQVSSLFSASSLLELRAGQDSIQLELNQENKGYKRIIFNVDGNQTKIENLARIGDLLPWFDSLSLKHYWKKEQVVFLFYTFLRVYVSSMSRSLVLDVNARQATDELESLLNKQRELTTLLVQLLESTQIQHSSYVVNDRAKHLLSLGLEPREQYSRKQIRIIGRQWMRMTHPDTVLGDEEVFKRVNEAVAYLSK